MIEAGTIVGRYRVEAVLGQGGMGTVYRATPTTGGDPVAIKMLNPGFSELPDIRARFEREAKASSFLLHPHIAAVHELGATPDGNLYLVMELATGENLGDIVDRGPLHPRRALIVLRQTLQGLGHAHQHGLVHRDMKPDNIMVTRAGAPGQEHDFVKLLDFGIVKILSDVARQFGDEALTRTGAVFGTPKYMAPEQALGRGLDHRADLYSSGIVLYEILTGRPPYQSDDYIELLKMHASKPMPPLPEAPWATPAMTDLVNRATAKDPDQRFSTTVEMIAAIDTAFVSIDHIAN